MNTHQVLIILIVDTRVLGCVADPLQECRFASISTTDYKDTKASIFRSEVIGINVALGRWDSEIFHSEAIEINVSHHGRWGEEIRRANARLQAYSLSLTFSFLLYLIVNSNLNKREKKLSCVETPLFTSTIISTTRSLAS